MSATGSFFFLVPVRMGRRAACRALRATWAFKTLSTAVKSWADLDRPSGKGGVSPRPRAVLRPRPTLAGELRQRTTVGRCGGRRRGNISLAAEVVALRNCHKQRRSWASCDTRARARTPTGGNNRHSGQTWRRTKSETLNSQRGAYTPTDNELRGGEDRGRERPSKGRAHARVDVRQQTGEHNNIAQPP